MPPKRGAKAAKWVGMGRGHTGCPLPADYVVWGAPWALSGVRGEASVRNAFWRILKATERSYLHLYADALSWSNSVSCRIWGDKAEVWGICPWTQRRTAPNFVTSSYSTNPILVAWPKALTYETQHKKLTRRIQICPRLRVIALSSLTTLAIIHSHFSFVVILHAVI